MNNRSKVSRAPGGHDTRGVSVPLEKALPQIFVANLVLIISYGVFASGWMLTRTDWFPEVGGALALGGLFSWLAFVSKLLSEERIKTLQSQVEAKVLLNHRTLQWVLVASAITLVAINFIGTIEVISEQETTAKVVRANYTGAHGVADTTVLAPAGHKRFLFLTTWLWHPPIDLKVSGYPLLTAEVAPLEVLKIHIPSTLLLNPVVLLKPTSLVIDAAGSPMQIEVLVTRAFGKMAFDGKMSFDAHAIWIGCDGDVDIPAAVEDSWRAELKASKEESRLTFWNQPKQVPGIPPLSSGDKIEVRLFVRGKLWGNPIRFEVSPVRSRRDFPQIVTLDGPSGGESNATP